MKKKINTKKEIKREGCDDCVVCKVMKTGEADSFEGLKKAFDKQNTKKGLMTMRVQNKDDLYYDAMDVLLVDDFETAEKMLLKAKEIDQDYVQAYVGLVSAYSRQKDKDKREECIRIAFEKTVKAFPKWPKRMEWGLIEYRAYMRAIQYMADLYWDKNDIENAEKLFKLLLKLNPNDNQGVRYEISAMLAGLTGPELNKMFDEGNKRQNWDKLERLVDIQNRKYKFWKAPKDC